MHNRLDSTPYERVEHIVKGIDSPESEQALCGAEVPEDEPWNTGWPWCRACIAVAQGRMS